MKKLLIAFGFVFSFSPMFASAQVIPTVSYIGPSTAGVGDRVFVYGSNFDSETIVVFNGINGTYILQPSIAVVDPTSLSFLIPSSLRVGNHTLAVTQRMSQWGLSSSVNLKIISKPQAPFVSSVSPSTVSAGDIMYIYGNDFDSSTNVSINGVSIQNAFITVTSPTSLYFTVPSTVSPGRNALAVVAKAGSWDLSPSVNFTVVENSQTPAIAITSPSGGSFSAGSTLTVNWNKMGQFPSDSYYFVYLKKNPAQILGSSFSNGINYPLVFRSQYLGHPSFNIVLPTDKNEKAGNPITPGTYYLEVNVANPNGNPIASATSNELTITTSTTLTTQINPISTVVTTSSMTEAQRQETIRQLQELLRSLIQQLIELIQKQSASVAMSQGR